MTKKNLPNIPLYIGDWERDCNILTLESEMAWMKIIFKMHLNGKQSTYKTSTKGLQILWKSNQEKVNEIIEELLFNEICGIEEIKGGYVFTSRRFEKENSISKKRSDAVKTRYKNKIEGTNYIQTLNKSEQNTEDEIENESEIDNAYEFLKEKSPSDLEIFEMQNKKTFQNYELFITNFNSIVIEKGIEFIPKILFARLVRLNANWDKKPKNTNKKALSAMEILKGKKK